MENIKVNITQKLLKADNTVKVEYSFDAYGADEPVNSEYDKTLVYYNDQWYVTTDLPVGKMVKNLKNKIKLKKQD